MLKTSDKGKILKASKKHPTYIEIKIKMIADTSGTIQIKDFGAMSFKGLKKNVAT